MKRQRNAGKTVCHAICSRIPLRSIRLDVIQELRERYRNVHVDDKGRRYNTDLLEAIELGFLLDIAEVVVVAARRRTGEPRRSHARRLSRPG